MKTTTEDTETNGKHGNQNKETVHSVFIRAFRGRALGER
jgi:hypothetical protein